MFMSNASREKGKKKKREMGLVYLMSTYRPQKYDKTYFTTNRSFWQT